MRTPQNFVDDMLAGGRTWIDIMTVSGCIRGGSWKNAVTQIMLERKLMPADPLERARLSTSHIARQKAKQAEEEMAATAARRLRGGHAPKAAVDPRD